MPSWVVRVVSGWCAPPAKAFALRQQEPQALLADNLALLEESGRFDFFKQGDSDFPFEDIALIKGADRYDFVMVGQRKQTAGFEYVEVMRHNGV